MKAIKTAMLITLTTAMLAIGCSQTPVAIKTDKETYILKGAHAKIKILATILDADNVAITEGVEPVFFCSSTKVIKVSQDGTVESVSSGEAKIEIEVAGTDLKIEVPIRVKIAGNIEVSHEKLRLWTGQVKENVCSWVNSEKGAYIEGYLPSWNSEDPTIVSVEQIEDPQKNPKTARSYVKMTGKKSGDTYIITSFEHLTKSIRIRVYDDDEEVDLSGRRISAEEKAKVEAEKQAAKEEKAKNKK